MFESNRSKQYISNHTQTSIVKTDQLYMTLLLIINIINLLFVQLSNMRLLFLMGVQRLMNCYWRGCSIELQLFVLVQNVALSRVNSYKTWLGTHALIKRRMQAKFILFFRVKHSIAPGYLCERLTQSVDLPRDSGYSLRNNNLNDCSIASRLKLYESSFLSSTLNAWNKLPHQIKSCTTANQF